MRRILAAGMAAILTLAMAGAALATDVPETLHILATQSITGVPASVAYGDITPGTASTPVSFTVAITSNVAWRVDMAGTDFNQGATVLSASAREVKIDTITGTPLPLTTVANFTSFGVSSMSAIPGTGAGELSAAVGTGQGAKVNLRINAPSTQAAGDYTGTFTIVLGAS